MVDSGFPGQSASETDAQAVEFFRFLGFAFPDDECAPAEFAQGALMNFVTRGVAIELGEPPVASAGRRRAVLASAMPMPEAAVNKYGEALFCEDEVGRDEARAQFRLRRSVSAD